MGSFVLRLAWGPFVLLGLLGCLARETGRPLGERCFSNDSCNPGLQCDYGRCRQLCTTDRQCPAGAVCVAASGAPHYYVCTLSDEGQGQGCPDGLVEAEPGTCRRPCDSTPSEPSEECGPAQDCSAEGWCLPRTSVAGGRASIGGAPDGGIPADLVIGGGCARADAGAGEVVTREAPGQWVCIPADRFEMGSPEEELGRYADELLHTVALTRDFWMMTTEVTQRHFSTVMGYNPSTYDYDCGENCPVETLTWHEMAAYANALSLAEGAEELDQCYHCTGTAPDVECLLNSRHESPYACPWYRLPTEAEWEYAARGGTTWGTYHGPPDSVTCDADGEGSVLDSIACYCYTLPREWGGCRVGEREPNDFGLYDMLGNVWEWCHDGYGPYREAAVMDPVGPGSAPARVLRGGSWFEYPMDIRAANRIGLLPSMREDDYGGRIVKTAP